MPLGLIALAIGGFGIGLTEFVIMGLLPEVAADFGVTEAAAGWLISGYALAVVVGALGLTAATTRLPRKRVLMGLLVLFIAGNAISAMAPTYELMMTGRIIAALCHGAFFGIGSVVAASLVAPEKAAGAIAIMFTGLTAANVLGVPFGTFLGQEHGWRSTFWVISAIGVLALIGIATLVPNLRTDIRPRAEPPPRAHRVPLRPGVALARRHGARLRRHVRRVHLHRLHAHRGERFRRRAPCRGCSCSSAPDSSSATGSAAVSPTGRSTAPCSASSRRSSSCSSLFAWLASNPVATIVLLVAHGRIRVRHGARPAEPRHAHTPPEAPTLASGANIAAFNLGNALGAWAGGLTIAAGLGYTSPIWVGAVITLAALVVMVVAAATARRTAPIGCPGSRRSRARAAAASVA